MTLAQDIKAYAEKSFEDAKSVAVESRKPFYAWVGANDLALEQGKTFFAKVQEQAEEFSTDFNAKLADLRKEIEKALAESREKAQELPTRVGKFDLDEAKKAFDDYSSQVAKFYGQLSTRGEKVFDELSKDFSKNPVVKKVVDAANEATESTRTLILRGQKNVNQVVEDGADAVIDGARDVASGARDVKKSARTGTRSAAAREGAAKRTSTTSSTAAKKAPAKKTAAKKAPAKSATAQKAPATKATTAQSTPAKPSTGASNS